MRVPYPLLLLLAAAPVHAFKTGGAQIDSKQPSEAATDKDGITPQVVTVKPAEPIQNPDGCTDDHGLRVVCPIGSPESSDVVAAPNTDAVGTVTGSAMVTGINTFQTGGSGSSGLGNALRGIRGATGAAGSKIQEGKESPQPIVPDVKVGEALQFPPAKTPEAQKARDEYVRLTENGGDKEAAHEFLKKALESSPDDPALRAFAALSDPKKGADSKTVKKRAAELLEGLRKEEDVPQGGTLLASPISFGAAGSAGAGVARPPLAGLFTKTPDLRSQAVQREAGGKIGMKDYAGAEAVLTRRIEEAPTDGAAFRLRALSRRLTGRYADSAQDARKAVEIDPRDNRSLHLLSRDYTDLGKPQEGLAEADRALQLNARDADAYVARSFAYAALNKPDEQLQDLQRAATLDVQFEDLYHDALAVRGQAIPAKRSWPVWFGAIGTALLFFSFALFRKRGDSSLRVALRQEDHDVAVAAAPKVASVPKGFKVIKTLGQGGMGVVYEAMDLGLHRTVALKKLRAEIAENERERNRFLKEARTVAALKHPNIVEIHSIHEDAEGLFLVFERVPGESLHERLGKGPIPPGEAAALLRQIASALDYAHQQGVVHQDLKPGNVMIHAGLAKVMDFGIARRVQETLSTMSKVEIAGTPAYMAPEQEQGVVGPSADVFALGACAYETLTGSLPYPTGGLMLKAQKMYRKPSEATPRLTPAVDAAIGRALEPKPEDRWPTASSFVDALARALS